MKAQGVNDMTMVSQTLGVKLFQFLFFFVVVAITHTMTKSNLGLDLSQLPSLREVRKGIPPGT